jgi:hypothetical protein
MNDAKQDVKTSFFIEKPHKILTTTEVTTPYYLIKIKVLFLPHFYYSKYKIKLESGNEPYPSRVLYISLSKTINDYYAPKV